MNFQLDSSRSPARCRTLRHWLLLLLLTAAAAVFQIQSVAAQSPDFRMQGWATLNGGTTGGAGGEVVTVSTPMEFLDAAFRDDPVVILINGSLDFSTVDSSAHSAFTSRGAIRPTSNKSFLGLGANAEIRHADLSLSAISNIIVRNITFRGSPDTAIGVRNGTTNVWIDHNDFSDTPDGLVDISGASDFITVSWNRFSDHNKTALIGSGDGHTGDRGRLRVTYHNNWFLGTNQRNPRVRFGRVHLFNNYSENVNVGVGIGAEAQIYSEQNHWDNASRPFHYYDNSDQPGYMKDTGSIVDGGTIVSLRPSGVNWSPKDHYNYTVHAASDVRNLARSYTGIGIIDPQAKHDSPNPVPDEPVDPIDQAGLIAHYPLNEGTGNTTADKSGFGSPLNLTLSGGATWLPGGGVRLDGDTGIIQSPGGAAKLADQIAGTGKFSVEVWAKPTKSTQSGPARLVSHSGANHLRNFTLGQDGSDLVFRVRATQEGDDNGLPEIDPGISLAGEITQYVVTFDGENVRMYRNGALTHTAPRAGSLANWDRDFPLVLGNEVTGTRGWAGELHGVAIFDRALSGAEVQERFKPLGGDPSNPDSFASWVQSAFPDATETSPQADPGGHGVPLLVRYVLGLDPKNPNPAEMHKISLQPNPTSGNNFLTIEYNRLKETGNASVVVEVSDDLRTWEALDESAVVEVVPNGDLDKVKVRDPKPIAEGQQRFMRLRINLL